MLSTVITMEDEDDRAAIEPRGYARAYEVVAGRIERRIMAGEFGYHDPLPSEPDLAAHRVAHFPNVRVLCTHDTASH